MTTATLQVSNRSTFLLDTMRFTNRYESRVHCKPNQPDESTRVAATYVHRVAQGCLDETQLLLSGTMVARVLREALEAQQTLPETFVIVAQMWIDLDEAVIWRYLPKGSLRAIVKSHEALAAATDAILRELPTVEKDDKLGKTLNILTAGDRLLGVLLRYFAALATEIIALRLLCILQKHTSA